jgi:long-chain acyl-CoA synthetase
VVPSGVFDVLEQALASEPAGTALVTASGRTTYAELDALADRAAGALYSLGLRPGDRLAVSWPNDLPIIAAFHGAMRLGAVWVGINQVLAAPEKRYMISDSGAPLALLSPEDGPLLPGATIGPGEWEAAIEASAGRPPVPAPDPEAPAAIAYTSGTTGYPKGAVHCQAGLVLPGAATVARRGWGADLRKGDSLPLTILNMFTLTTLLAAQARGTAVIFDRSDVRSIVNWIGREKVTVWNGPPAQLWTMIRDPGIEPSALASLEEVWAGGADCPESLRDQFEERFGVPVVRTYGLTEAPALVCLDDLGGSRPAGTSGRPLDHIHLESVDGEIRLSPQAEGPWAGVYRPMIGYWNRPDATAEALAGRTLRTGDLGLVEPSGHLRVLGRKSTVIIRGGANVYPAEVERILAEAPGVGASSVVGVPDERLGERVGAALEPKADEEIDVEAVLQHCRDNLAAYKIPERIVVVPTLPRNQMGKVPRAEVLDLLAATTERKTS